MRTDSYLVTVNDGVVEAWSSERLRYDVAQTWHHDFRSALRRAISKLAGGGETLVAATYGSDGRDLCDAENILFYNVGAGCFTKVAQLGIRFERRFDSPPPPDALTVPAAHYHRYERAAPGEAFRHWSRFELVASCNDVQLPRLTEGTKTATVWLPMRRALLDRLPDTNISQEPVGLFALRLRLRTPDPQLQPARIIKPLLDGTIAALQRHNPSDLNTNLAQRLAAQLPASTADITALLVDPRIAPLGTGRVVVPWANGVQWQPLDDRCVACELVVEQGSASEGTVLQVVVWSVRP